MTTEEFSKEFRISECVYDLTTIATTLIHDYDVDVDSRCVFVRIYELAKEFEENFNEDEDDYMLKIEEFGYEKLMKYLDIKHTFTGYVAQLLAFEVEATTKDEASKIIKKKLEDAGFKPCSGGVDIVFNKEDK